jgi:hypothetical protein
MASCSSLRRQQGHLGLIDILDSVSSEMVARRLRSVGSGLLQGRELTLRVGVRGRSRDGHRHVMVVGIAHVMRVLLIWSGLSPRLSLLCGWRVIGIVGGSSEEVVRGRVGRIVLLLVLGVGLALLSILILEAT